MSLSTEAPKASYYDTLQIPKGASEVEIKKAYRKLAMKWHPGSKKQQLYEWQQHHNNQQIQPIFVGELNQ